MVLKVNIVEFFPINESDDYVINKEGDILRLSRNEFVTTNYLKMYPRVNLVFDGKRVTRAIHRLLAQAFIPKVEGKEFINHINGVKNDYRLCNLEWCTRSENMLHSIHVLKNPKPPSNKGNTGSLSKLSKPVKATCIKTGEVFEYAGAKEAIRQSNGLFHPWGIRQSILGNCKQHQGYVWSFLEEVNNV